MTRLMTLTFSMIVAFSASQAMACASANGGRHNATKRTLTKSGGSSGQTQTQKK